MSQSTAFMEAVKGRRTYYALQKKSSISDARLKDIVDTAMISVPSAFNGQTSRVVVLLGKDHDQFWGYVWEAVKSHLRGKKDREASTKARMDGFANAYGTILFFEDPTPSNELALKFHRYADKFPSWADQHNGMLQHTLWVALEAEGMGVSIQHYNPLIDVVTKQRWNIPSDWGFKAQMVFGELKDGESRLGWTENKEIQPLEQRVTWYGANL
ncbi:MAG: hypothetical protein Q9162_004018 [Coniocarpon cinnabarinum]